MEKVKEENRSKRQRRQSVSSLFNKDKPIILVPNIKGKKKESKQSNHSISNKHQNKRRNSLSKINRINADNIENNEMQSIISNSKNSRTSCKISSCRKRYYLKSGSNKKYKSIPTSTP